MPMDCLPFFLVFFPPYLPFFKSSECLGVPATLLSPPPHTEPKWPTRWSAVNLPNWLLHLYLADLLVLLLLEVVVEVEVVE